MALYHNFKILLASALLIPMLATAKDLSSCAGFGSCLDDYANPKQTLQLSNNAQSFEQNQIRANDFTVELHGKVSVNHGYTKVKITPKN